MASTSTTTPIPSHMVDWATPSPSWKSVEAAQREVDEISKQALTLPIAQLRAFGYRPPPLPRDVPEPGKDIDISTIEVPVRDGTKIPLRLYRRKSADVNAGADAHAPLFFNIHGGGWVMGVPETEEAQNRLIAVKNNVVVVSVDYRKAPEFPYPIPLNDCYDAVQWARHNAASLGADAQKIIIGGGSAGANLTAAVTLKAQADGITGIIGQLLNIPVTCHPEHFPTGKYPYFSYVQNAASPIVDAWKMNWFWAQYLSGSSSSSSSSSSSEALASDPSVSPLLASKEALEGLPPALVQVAGMDPLRDEGLAYAEALKSSGVPVTVKLYPGVPHAFYIHPNLPESAEYFQTMVDWIDDLVRPRARDGTKM